MCTFHHEDIYAGLLHVHLLPQILLLNYVQQTVTRCVYEKYCRCQGNNQYRVHIIGR